MNSQKRERNKPRTKELKEIITMTTTMKNAVRYINDDTAMVTKAFMKKASIFGTAEFNTWREYKALFPNATMVVKTIKKNPQKKTSTKNMTYENMVAFEVYLKVAHLYGGFVRLCGKKIGTLHIPVLELEPSSQDGFCLGRKEDKAVFPAFGDFRSKKYFSVGQVNIFNKENATLAYTHTAINHQHNHCVVSVFGVIGLVQASG